MLFMSIFTLVIIIELSASKTVYVSEEEDTGSKSRKGSPTKRRSNSRQPPSNAGSDVANTEELESPTKTRRSPRKKRSQVKKKDMSNGDSDEGVSSATTTTRTLSTAATDLTSSSGVSSHTPGRIATFFHKQSNKGYFLGMACNL